MKKSNVAQQAAAQITQSPTAMEEIKPIPILLEKTQVVCETSKGRITIHLSKENLNSKKYLLQMVEDKYFEAGGGVAFFRVNDAMTQFGPREKIYKYKGLKQEERDLHPIKDRKKRIPWIRGDLSMIGGVHMVLCKSNKTRMGLNDHDTVVGHVSEADMANVIDKLYMYNDPIDHPKIKGPTQGEVWDKGWAYLNAEFPLIDRIISCVAN